MFSLFTDASELFRIGVPPEAVEALTRAAAAQAYHDGAVVGFLAGVAAGMVFLLLAQRLSRPRG